jgi:hypothetical protein
MRRTNEDLTGMVMTGQRGFLYPGSTGRRRLDFMNFDNVHSRGLQEWVYDRVLSLRGGI